MSQYPRRHHSHRHGGYRPRTHRPGYTLGLTGSPFPFDYGPAPIFAPFSAPGPYGPGLPAPPPHPDPAGSVGIAGGVRGGEADDGEEKKTDGEEKKADGEEEKKTDGDDGEKKDGADQQQQMQQRGLFRMTGESPVMARPAIGPVVIPTHHARGGSAFVVRNIGHTGARDAKRIPHGHYAAPLHPHSAQDITHRLTAATERRNEHLDLARQRAHVFSSRVPVAHARRGALDAERRQRVASRVAVGSMVAEANRRQYLGEIRGHAHEEMVRVSEHAARAVYDEYRHAEAVDLASRSRDRHALLSHDQQLRARSRIAHQLAAGQHLHQGWHPVGHYPQGVYTHAATATTTSPGRPAAAAPAAAAPAEGAKEAEAEK